MGKVGRILIFAREIILNIPEWSKLKIQKKIREKTQPLYHICGQQMDNGIAVLVLGWVLISETTK